MADISFLGEDLLEEDELGECWSSTEDAMRASYDQCGYSEEEVARLDTLISVSSYVQCSGQSLGSLCLERVMDNWYTWLETFNTPTTAPAECDARVSGCQ